MRECKWFSPAKILKELFVVSFSAVVAMVIPSSLMTFGVIKSPGPAYALMFWLYAQCYLVLKKFLLKNSLAVKLVEFEAVSVALTVYMVLLLPVMKDQPGIIQLPACYWTFVFISMYISFRGTLADNALRRTNAGTKISNR